MSALQRKYEEFAEFMQHNTKGVEIGIYSVSGILFAVSYYKMRPITKFGRSSDIPKHFITKRIVQFGKIKAIEPNMVAGALLRIDHKPPLNLLFASQKTLPVKIFGVDINSNGYSWLESVTTNHKVQFIPIKTSHSDFAECQVILLQNPFKHSKPNIDLAESLISLGFAKTVKQSKDSGAVAAASTDAQLKNYLKKLQSAQSKASGRGLPWPLSILMAQIWRLIYVKVLPSKYRLPELVR